MAAVFSFNRRTGGGVLKNLLAAVLCLAASAW